MPARRGPQTAVQAQAIAIRDLEVLRAPSDASVIQRVRGEIGEFTKNYPVPGIA